MNSGKVFIGILAVAAAGVLAGILFAPAKGSKTRKQIMKRSSAFLDVLRLNFNKFLEAIFMKYDKILNDVFYDDRINVNPEEEVLQESQII